MLEFDPAKRISAEEALQHPYLSHYHNAQDEPSHPKLFDFAFETTNSIEELKKLISAEVVDHKQKREAAQMTFSTPSSSPMHLKPHLDASTAQSIPRCKSQDELVAASTLEEEIEKEMNGLKL